MAGRLDVLITEGTNIRAAQGMKGGGASGLLRDEVMVEEAAGEMMENHDGTVFVLCSSTNEPRIRAMDVACKRAGRLPCHDLFLTAVRGKLAEGTCCKAQPFVASYIDPERTPRVYRYFSHYYGQHALVGAESLAKIPQSQTVFLRTSMLPFLKSYLKARGGTDHALIYSMWEGYCQTTAVQTLLTFCRERDIKIVSFHCSGHAYQRAIKSLIWRLKPKALIPIHCDKNDRALFEAYHHNCVMLSDGERMEL